ncbi:MAG: ankyrin repeat domain-containing protein [Candidatus Thiodiazotropha sp.]
MSQDSYLSLIRDSNRPYVGEYEDYKDCNEVLTAAERGHAFRLSQLINTGCKVNYQDPDTGATALHMAAANQALKVLRYLITLPHIDYLLRDKKGRLASEMAFIYGHDPAVARLLRIKEKKQGESKGIKVTRRPKSD